MCRFRTQNALPCHRRRRSLLVTPGASTNPGTTARRSEEADHGDSQLALGAGIDHVLELSHWDRKRLHNLKYFTWVEQQGKTVDELDAQWDDPAYWTSKYHAWQALDDRIRAFNDRWPGGEETAGEMEETGDGKTTPARPNAEFRMRKCGRLFPA